MRAQEPRRCARPWRFVFATLFVFTFYQAVIFGILIIGLGGSPNYFHMYPAWENAHRIVGAAHRRRST